MDAWCVLERDVSEPNNKHEEQIMPSHADGDVETFLPTWGISPSSLHLSACVSLSREPLHRPCWRDKRHSLPPSLLPPSLPASCDSPALWSIPSEGLMMGPSCVREGAGLPLMWSAQQRASLENRRPRWLRWPAACSRTAPALDILGSDYKLAARSREA